MHDKSDKEKIIRSICSSHCGGTCEMKVHVKGDRIVRIEPDDGDNTPRMCARGHAYRQRVYAPDRLLYPLKRSGNQRGLASLPEFPGTRPWKPSPAK